MSLLIHIIRRYPSIAYFFFCWAAVMLLYAPAYQAGFIGEYIHSVQSYEKGSFTDFLNRADADIKNLFQVVQLQLYGLLYLFGANPLPWFLLLTGLHALNGLLAFRFFAALYRDFGVSYASLKAWGGSLLFLFNPNITEVIVWKACDHYLTSILTQLVLLAWCRQYLLTARIKYAWLTGILFAITTYTLEIFYVIPFLTCFLLLGYYYKGLIDPLLFRRGIRNILLPQVIFLLLHFFVFRMVYGGWIPHYGTEEGSFMSDPAVFLRGYGKYISYIGLMAGHYPWEIRQAVYGLLSQPPVYYTITALLLCFPFYILLRFRSVRPEMQVAGFLAGAFICSTTLAVSVYFDDLFSLYNSRRCYQPGLFFYMLAGLAFFSIRNKRLAWISYGLYFMICIVLTGRMVMHWRTAAKIQHGILRHFDGYASDPVLLLNIPCYYKHVRIIPANRENEFLAHLRILGYKPFVNEMFSVASYNMTQPWDGAHVTVLDSVRLKVTLNQWGTWWMYQFRGAQSYENDIFRVDMTDPGHEYILILKQRPENIGLYFHQGQHWRKVDMSAGRFGQEQW